MRYRRSTGRGKVLSIAPRRISCMMNRSNRSRMRIRLQQKQLKACPLCPSPRRSSAIGGKPSMSRRESRTTTTSAPMRLPGPSHRVSSPPKRSRPSSLLLRRIIPETTMHQRMLQCRWIWPGKKQRTPGARASGVALPKSIPNSRPPSPLQAVPVILVRLTRPSMPSGRMGM